MSGRYDRNDHYRSSRRGYDYDRRRSRSRSRSPPSHRSSDVPPVSYNTSSNVHLPTLPPGVAPIAMPGTETVSGFGMGMPNLLAQAQAQQMEKISRELFVGNIPPNIPEMLLRDFFNGAMKRTGLCAPNATPIVGVRISPKFAFIECATVHDANQAMNMNGIPFMNIALRVSRPSKYVGPYVPSKTWQQLTGQPLPPGCQPVPENGTYQLRLQSYFSIMTYLLFIPQLLGPSGEDKIDRELFVGNTTPEMTEEGIRDFLGKALEQVGLSNSPGNPILNCRMSGKYAFIELRTIDETKKAMNLNNIP